MTLQATDEELASRAARGDAGAFEALVRRYADALYAQCRGLTADGVGAEDLVQETFLRAYRSLGQFDPGRPFAPWICRIAQNACVDALRRRKSWQPLAEEDRTTQERTPAADPTERLEGLLNALPGKYRAILHHKYALGLNAAEIAERLQLSHEDVRVCLHRALGILREKLIL